MFKKTFIGILTLFIVAISALPAMAYSSDGTTITLYWSDILWMAENGYITLAEQWYYVVTMTNGSNRLSVSAGKAFETSGNGIVLNVLTSGATIYESFVINSQYGNPVILFDFSWLGTTIDTFSLQFRLLTGYPAQSHFYTTDSTYNPIWTINNTEYQGTYNNGYTTLSYSGTAFTQLTFEMPFVGDSSIQMSNIATQFFYLVAEADSDFQMTIVLNNDAYYSTTIINSANASASAVLDDMNSIESTIVDNLEEAWEDIDVDTTLSANAEDAVVNTAGYIEDIWDALGQFQMIISFPLLLALILVVVGRKEKTNA